MWIWVMIFLGVYFVRGFNESGNGFWIIVGGLINDE